MPLVFEKVRDSKGSSFAFHRGGEELFDCPYHMHPEVEILHIITGQGHLVVGDHVGRFASGDLMLLGSGLPHILRVDDAAPGQDVGPELRYVQFRPEDFGERFWQLREMQPAARLLTQGCRGLRFDHDATVHALALLDRMWAASGTARLLRMIEVLGTLAGAAQWLPMASLGYASKVTHRDSERLNRAMHYISDHLTDTLTLDAVAAQAGLSRQAFSRFFHRLVGMSYLDYVLSLRLSLACRLLLESEKGVAEIAFQVGFNNLSNFNRQFHKVMGTAPRAYRSTVPRLGRLAAEQSGHHSAELGDGPLGHHLHPPDLAGLRHPRVGGDVGGEKDDRGVAQ
jgi:AraC-like DNA-binding protein